ATAPPQQETAEPGLGNNKKNEDRRKSSRKKSEDIDSEEDQCTWGGEWEDDDSVPVWAYLDQRNRETVIFPSLRPIYLDDSLAPEQAPQMRSASNSNSEGDASTGWIVARGKSGRQTTRKGRVAMRKWHTLPRWVTKQIGVN
ncbi:unnamed protein product, partial [Amoebophrya sp. A25]